MSLRQYRYITAIADLGNLTRAAEMLYVSQPALSRVLQNVEGELGLRLFNRNGKQMRLTAAGEIYVEHAKEILALDKEIHSKIKGTSTPKHTIYLRCQLVRMSFFSEIVLPRYLSILGAGYLELDVMKKTPPQLGEDEIAMSFGLTPCTLPDAVMCAEIADQEMVLVVPTGSPLIAKAQRREGYTYPYIDAQDFIEEPFIAIDENRQTGRHVSRFFSEREMTPNRKALFFTPTIAYRMVANGAGVSILPDVPLFHMGMEGRIEYLSVEPSSYAKKLVMTVAREYRDNRMVKDFSAFVKQNYYEKR